MNEDHSIGDLVTELRAAAPWREVLVVDDGSTDATAARAETAGARVIRHPYNKGNGAAVKTGIRAALGEFILIIDADHDDPRVHQGGIQRHVRLDRRARPAGPIEDSLRP